MRKRFASLLLALALLVSLSTPAAAAFSRVRSYDGRFADVRGDEWYAPYVTALYEYGLTEGRGDGGYAPLSDVTLGELAAFTARVRAAHEGLAIPAASNGEAWYAPYLAFLREETSVDAALLARPDDVATRAEMAGLLSAALPEGTLTEPNADLVVDAYASGDYITDVTEYTPYQREILQMYRQGLLNGTDAYGSFRPMQTVNRAEIAALLTRMLDESLRLTLSWTLYPAPAAQSWGELVEKPQTVNTAPDAGDAEAIDALIRDMLARESNTLTLRYPAALSTEKLQALSDALVRAVKTYCEQMYDGVTCRMYSDGTVIAAFSCGGCESDEQLAQLREETMQRALAVHDELWENGTLTMDMSERERAGAYFLWLCGSCMYDYYGTEETSLSHTAYGALVNGRAVCDGYTGLYNLLLKLESIECRALYNTEHIWTVAVLDGEEVHIDTTWGDQARGSELKYFAMTAEESYQYHAW